MSSGVVGQIYKFKVRAYNINSDFIDTNSLSVALAALPSKPVGAPVSDPAVTNMQTLKVTFALFTTEAQNGGSEITNYDIQYDDGMRGPFTSVI